jgi:radical SAM superfamily enzyme YgiQ (UPF0313 family)
MNEEKILLMLLPFWDPQIPPPGIACLKSYLHRHGCRVRAVDANIEDHLKETYYNYFDTLKGYVPEGRQGNFNKIGFDVFHNHMMAYMHRGDEEEYLEVLKDLVRSTFFVDFAGQNFLELDRLIAVFFQRLEDYIIEVLAVERPDVLGITVYTDTLAASLLAFKLAKEKYPGIRTVMGGGIFAGDMAMGTPNMRYFLEKADYVDKILVGEGERLFLTYLQGQLPGTTKVASLQDIDNEILDITDAEVPDFSDFHLGHYPYLATYTSRSCPYRCEFCTERLLWGKYRKKSAPQVVKELLTLYDRYGFQLFFMSDSLLNPVIMDLAHCLVKEEISIYWDGYLRAHGLACDTGNTMLWRRGGFYRARLGLESGSPKVLGAMNKGITLGEIRGTVSALAYAGIKTTTYWLLGFPGETEADFQETLDLIEEMTDDIYEVNCSPFWYFQSAQGGDSRWKDKSVPLYPEKSRERFLLQTWIVDCEPSREEIYHRMWRFTEHCKKLGIPTPYSLQDFHNADRRWAELHKNAVPAMVWFGNKGRYTDENKKIEKLITARKTGADDGDFGF